jgi:carbon monoxide dehydrogenase subunit G
MSHVHVKIRIEAPVQQVWDTIMDPRRLEQWVTIHRSLADMSDEPTRKGAAMEQVMHMRGINFRVHWTLVDVNPPTHAEWDGRGPAHSRARIRYELTGDGDATEFEYFNEFTTPGGRLGNLATRVIVGEASDREARNSLQRLKELLERNQ